MAKLTSLDADAVSFSCATGCVTRRLVASFGLGENTGRVDEPETDLAPVGSRDDSEAIWTPQSASAASGTSKLWLPGAD